MRRAQWRRGPGVRRDIEIAADNATFSVSEAKFGILRAMIGPHVVNAAGRRHIPIHKGPRVDRAGAGARVCWRSPDEG